MVMYSGQPVVSFYIPTSNDADIIATTTTDTSTQLSERSVFTGGTTVLLKIRPHDGKYIKSLVMNDKHKQDENPGVDSKEYKLADIYSDDMYSFQAELEQGEKVCDSKYDNDAGNLVFTNDSGVDKKYYYSNEPVQVSVIPYDGYMSDGVEITAANDLRSIETTVLDNGSMGYKFSMPDENVTITPYYRLIDDDEHLAELSFNKGGSVSFTDCNTVSNAYINKML